MTTNIQPASSTPPQRAEKAITLALRLAQAESALQAFASGQVDAIVDSDGQTYLLRSAQENLRQHERRLQSVIDSTIDVITIVDRGGTIIMQSHAVSSILGYEIDALLGKSIFDFVHEDDLAQLFSTFFNVIETFSKSGTARFRHQTRDGSYQLIEATVGKLIGAIPESVILNMRPIKSFAPTNNDSAPFPVIGPRPLP